MKKIAIAALAALTLGVPVLAQAQPVRHNDHRNPPRTQNHVRPAPVRAAPVRAAPVRVAQRVQYRNWRQGQRFDQRQAHRYRVINRPGDYRLRPAPRGYRWVQSNNDAVLVAITTGLIAQVLANRF
jgi:Ni/Co efflux regulator RcnB